MSFGQENPYQAEFANHHAVALSDEWERTAFMRRTYAHLAAAVGLFMLIEVALFTLVPPATQNQIMQWMVGGRWNFLIVLGAFMVVSWIADGWARSATSLPTQYAGLILYVVAEAAIFFPILFIARHFGGEHTIEVAGLLTAVVFGGLTVVTMVTKADFSWLGRYLALAGILAFAFIACSFIFPGMLGSIGPWFSVAMIGFASAYILYYTSNIMHVYRTDQHVAAALALFAAVALLFWYILQLLMSLSRD